MSEGLMIVYASLIGLALGSFLNVCIVRLPAGRSILRPRSSCPACGHQLAWFENIPVLSYIALGGRCRSCKVHIPLRYPAVEMAAALIWVGSYLYFDSIWRALTGALFGTILLGIAVTDARDYIIPDELSLGGLVIGLGLSFLPGGTEPLWSLVGAVAAFAVMYGVAVGGEWVFKKPALGGGDIKMMAMVGAFLGPGYAMLAIFVGSVVGAVIFGPIGLKTGKLVPFGLFLAVGAAVVFIWGDAMVSWYMTTVLDLYA